MNFKLFHQYFSYNHIHVWYVLYAHACQMVDIQIMLDILCVYACFKLYAMIYVMSDLQKWLSSVSVSG